MTSAGSTTPARTVGPLDQAAIDHASRECAERLVAPEREHGDVPTLIVWGAADRIVDPSHGAAYAERITDALLDVIVDAGHLPQLETPERLARDVWAFATAGASRS